MPESRFGMLPARSLATARCTGVVTYLSEPMRSEREFAIAVVRVPRPKGSSGHLIPGCDAHLRLKGSVHNRSQRQCHEKESCKDLSMRQVFCFLSDEKPTHTAHHLDERCSFQCRIENADSGKQIEIETAVFDRSAVPAMAGVCIGMVAEILLSLRAAEAHLVEPHSPRYG